MIKIIKSKKMKFIEFFNRFLFIILIFNLPVISIASLCDPTKGTDVLNNIWEDTVWSKNNSPYCIADTIKIINAVLTIEPGVQIKFIKGNINNEDATFSLVIDDLGKIVARGTETEQIVFTSNESMPKQGDWNAIIFSSTSTPLKTSDNGEYLDGSIFENVIIEYAYGYYGAIQSQQLPFFSHNITLYEVQKGIVNEAKNQKYLSNINFVNCKTEWALLSGYNPKYMDNVNFINCSSGSGLISFAKSEFDSLTISNAFFNNISTSRNCNIRGCYCIDFSKLYVFDSLFKDISYNAIKPRTLLVIKNTEFININNDAVAGSSWNYYDKTNVIIKNCIFNTAKNAIRGRETLILENTLIKNCAYNAISEFKNFSAINSSFINNGKAIESTNLTLTNSLVFQNGTGISIEENGVIKNSTIAYNNGNGLNNSGQIEITNSNIFNNKYRNLNNASPKDIKATNNYWGTTNVQAIKLSIYDKNNNLDYGLVTYTPILTNFSENTPQIPPWCDIEPEFLDFGYVEEQKESNLIEVIVSNSTISNVSIGNIFEILPPFFIYNNSCLNQILYETNSCQFEIVFKPQSSNRFNKTIIFPSDSIIQKKIFLTGYSRIDEGFESASFNKYNWKSDGEWSIQSDIKHIGNFSAKSPIPLTDNQDNSLSLTITTDEGYFSFYYKVVNSGKLSFYIDDKYIFSSYTTDWTLHSELLQRGVHTMKWNFYSGKQLKEAYLFLDTIIFPQIENPDSKKITVLPESFNFEQTKINLPKTKTFTVENINDNQLTINNIIFQKSSNSFNILNDYCSKHILLNKKKCTFDIVFKPQIIGFISETLELSYDNNQIQNIHLTGEGIGIDVLISGKVIYMFENYLELPIKNAIVNINELGFSCLTDDTGTFRLQLNNILPDNYTLAIKSVNFFKNIVLNISNDTNDILDFGNIQMQCINKQISLDQVIQDLKVLSGFENN